MRISFVFRCSLTLVILVLTYWVYSSSPGLTGEPKAAGARIAPTPRSLKATSIHTPELVVIPAP